MIFVWFIYGLAFFVLGLVILIYPRRDSRFRLAKHIWMIGVFGVVHGVNEWLDMFHAIGKPFPLELVDSRADAYPVRFLPLSPPVWGHDRLEGYRKASPDPSASPGAGRRMDRSCC